MQVCQQSGQVAPAGVCEELVDVLKEERRDDANKRRHCAEQFVKVIR